MIRRIAAVEGGLSRFDGIEDDISRIKSDLARALKPRDPDVTKDDFERWETNCRKTIELEEELNRMQRDMKEVP